MASVPGEFGIRNCRKLLDRKWIHILEKVRRVHTALVYLWVHGTGNCYVLITSQKFEEK